MRELFQKVHPEARLFCSYIIFAGIATLVDLGLLYYLTEFAGFYFLVSSALSYLCGAIVNYSLNKTFTFKNKSKKILHQFGLFVAVALVGLGLNQLIIWLLVEFAGLWYMLAKCISIIIVVFWNFFGHKKMAFGLLK